MRHTINPRDNMLAMGFVPIDGASGVYGKSYPQYGGYTLSVDIGIGRIQYADAATDEAARIIVGDGATGNFARPENFVVLECVTRLLDKGYAPNSIELEKVYPSGHGHSGRLDVLVKDCEGKPFLMIECKTWGPEYNKEFNKMIKDGGQLFTYYKNATAAKYLCLYASRLNFGEIEYINSIVDVQDEWASLSETKDIYDHWNKTFKENGIFESHATPYNVTFKRLTYNELKNMSAEDSGKIYNHIMEILRHNAVSDKPNAFNKILNLFVCKIIDETNAAKDDELRFQRWAGQSDEELQLTLNDLYKEGIWRFLNIDVIDYTTEELKTQIEAISGDQQSKVAMLEIFTDLRLKKSPNFAFAEVLDERSFRRNAKIVGEMVELLQGYKFRYEQKHEFLGKFFELLLNTSMKQEAGQFFTPVPITRFIISSLPVKELTQRLVEKKSRDPLPTVIDFACGSGHFLTEYMARMQEIIEKQVDRTNMPRELRGKFDAWSGIPKFDWAKQYVYGIDSDDRLVKTTKVSAFFNGDGEATVVWGNGLASFEQAEEYRGKLKKTVSPDKRDNGQFDILISNPPFSVQSFRTLLQNGDASFDLFKYITDNGSEIECLFVERMKQLLKPGGWAGVILPSSMLSNGGVYARTREIIFKYFNVKAIVELGSGTFMKTGTNTVILFLERRPDGEYYHIEQAITTFFDDKRDVTVAGIEHAFSKFVASVYDDLSFEDYVSFVNGAANAGVKSHELWLDYLKEFGDHPYKKALAVEREKLLYFLLTCEQNIVVVKSGQKRDEKEFLGYEFSERRGYEGIKFLPGGTKLFDENDILNRQKVNSYIYNAFLGKPPSEVDEAVAKYVSYGRMSGFFEYGTSRFDKRVNLRKRTKIVSAYQLKRLNQLVTVLRGVTYDKDRDQVYDVTDNTVLPADNITIDGKLDIVKKLFLRKDIQLDKNKKLRKGDLFICFSSGSKKHVGKCAFIKDDIPYYAGGFMGILRKTSEEIDMQYLWVILSSDIFRSIMSQVSTGSNINNLSNKIGELKIPLPPLDVQRQIVAEYEAFERNEAEVRSQMTSLRNNAVSVFDNQNRYTTTTLSQLAGFNPPRCEIADKNDNMLISFVEMAAVSNDGFIESSIERKLGETRKGGYTYFRDNDIIMAKITPCMENGKCALAKNLKNGIGMGSTEFHVLRCGDKVIPKYLFAFLNRPSIRETAQQQMTGASGHRRVPISFYQQLSIPLPPLEKQEEIVAEIEKQETEIARLRERLIELEVEKSRILDKYL